MIGGEPLHVHEVTHIDACRQERARRRRLSATTGASHSPQPVVIVTEVLLSRLRYAWQPCTQSEDLRAQGGSIFPVMVEYIDALMQHLGVAVDEVNWCLALPYHNHRNEALAIRGYAPASMEGVLTSVP